MAITEDENPVKMTFCVAVCVLVGPLSSCEQQEKLCRLVRSREKVKGTFTSLCRSKSNSYLLFVSGVFLVVSFDSQCSSLKNQKVFLCVFVVEWLLRCEAWA